MTNQSLEMSAADAASFLPRHIGPSDADVSAMLGGLVEKQLMELRD